MRLLAKNKINNQVMVTKNLFMIMFILMEEVQIVI